MKRSLLISSMMLVALGGCGPKNEATTPDNGMASNSTAETAQEPQATGAPGSDDGLGSQVSTVNFVEQASISDMYEIESSKMALQKAQSPEIKAFAKDMVAAHTATTAALKAIVAKSNGTLKPATALDPERARMISNLQGEGPDGFDKEYTDQQTQAHKKALNLMQAYMTSGDNPDLKAFATETAPKVQMHLDTITKLDHSGADEVKGGAAENTAG